MEPTTQPRDVILDALKRAETGPQFEYLPLRTESDAQRAASLDRQREREQQPAPSFKDQFDAALELESGTRGITRSIFARNEFEADPNYTPPAPGTPEFAEMTGGLPEEYWPRLGEARSAGHSRFIKDQISTELDAAQQLDRAGWKGTALRIATNVLDPVSLGPILLTGGASWIMQGSRVARAAKLATAGALENAAVEGTLLGTRETKDIQDLYIALVGGLVVGGTIGALTPAAKAKLYDTGRRIAAGDPVATDAAQGVAAHFDDSLSVGASRTARAPGELMAEQPLPEILNAPKLTGVEANVRFDWYGQLAKSENDYVRFIGNKLLADPVNTQTPAVEEFARVLKKRGLTEFYREADPALSDFLKGVPLGQRTAATNKFFEAVTNAVRMEDFTDPAIGRAARGMAQSLRVVAAEARRHGVKGFEALDLADNYVPRIPSAQKIDVLVQRFGSEQIETLLAQAFARGAGVTSETALKVSKGYIRNVRMRGAGVRSDFRVIAADKEVLADMMSAAGIPDNEAEAVLRELGEFGATDATKAGKIARAKRRLELDESTSAVMRDNAGQNVPVSITDLFENDARFLTAMYANAVGGHAALARAGVKSAADWEKLIRNARLFEADRVNRDPGMIEREVTKLQAAYDAITGKPLIDYSDPIRALSMVTRDYAYLSQSGMFGFAQASELAATLTVGGMRLITDAVPSLGKMFKRAANGKLSDELAAEIEEFIAPGTDALLHSVSSRFDSLYDEALIPQAHGILAKTETARHTLRKAAGYASGLTPITIAMQRLAARFTAQRLVNTAFDTGRGWSTSRLRAMGLTPEMEARVFGQIKTHSITQPSALAGKKLHRLDLESWTDLDARDAFVLAVSREVRRTSLESDLGSSIQRVASSELGKVLTQFMTFATSAHSKILLHGLKNMDAERAVSWSLGVALAGAAYTARTHLESLGRKDRDAFLRERLNPERIAAAAFNQAGFSALLPPMIDTALTIAPGVDPIFSYGRTSGLGTSFTDLGRYPVGSMVRGAGNLLTAANDGRLTQAEWQNVQRLLPFSRVLGLKQTLDALGGELPEK